MGKCREEFEKWANERDYPMGTDAVGWYIDEQTDFAWSGWQSAWNARVPEGYVVVPREPTKALIDALANNFIKAHGIPTRVTPTKAYRAMIAAAEDC